MLNDYRVLTIEYNLKYNLTAKDLVPVFISPVKSYSLDQTTSSSGRKVMSDSLNGLTQQKSQLTINNDLSRFLILVGIPTEKIPTVKLPTKKITYIKSQFWSTNWSGPR